MEQEYNLDFICQEDFEKHVKATLDDYGKALESIDLEKFNKNIVDPIKLLFDKNVFDNTFEETIQVELQRQRDKTGNNIIGYFHQNIFQYIDGCEVPEKGWDVIVERDGCTYYVEMKNKHNTMNSSSSQKTYMNMLRKLLDESNRKIKCALVEVIAKKSQNIPWRITLDGKKHPEDERIRRISIDKFYEIVTGDKDAFKKLCIQLPKTIEKVLEQHKIKIKDSVIEELLELDNDILTALYRLAFSTYEGFDF